jgi:hypothetical protein
MSIFMYSFPSKGKIKKTKRKLKVESITTDSSSKRELKKYIPDAIVPATNPKARCRTLCLDPRSSAVTMLAAEASTTTVSSFLLEHMSDSDTNLLSLKCIFYFRQKPWTQEWKNKNPA